MLPRPLRGLVPAVSHLKHKTVITNSHRHFILQCDGRTRGGSHERDLARHGYVCRPAGSRPRRSRQWWEAYLPQRPIGLATSIIFFFFFFFPSVISAVFRSLGWSYVRCLH